jgi:large subunit ribosomal protein L9
VKVIFIEDVTNVARAGQTKVVADGYARNFLFPRKLAVLENSRAAAAVEAHLKKLAKRRAIEEAEMAELAIMISGTEITLKAKVGENERLYGSVTGADIAGELSKTIGREVDKRKVDLTEPIRQIGVYDVTIRFTHDITAVVSVTVMSDEEGAARPEKAEKKAEKAEEPKAEKAETKEKKPKAEKKVKKETPAAEEKAEKVAEPKTAEKKEKPAKEKKAKAEKAVKEEKGAPAEKEEDKPPKEKKAKPEKAEKEEKPENAEKKEKKAKTEKRARKSDAKVEEAEEKEK